MKTNRPARSNRPLLLLTLLAVVLIPTLLPAQPSLALARARSPQAAPTPPPVFVAPSTPEPRIPNYGPEPGPDPLLYSIGQPTDEEQLYLEYINRSRANPTAEGQRLAAITDTDVLSAYSFFNVDLALMQYEFSTNPPVPPLAFNAKLINAARGHSTNMLIYDYQGHYETNGTQILGPGERITAQGYAFSTWGENVYAYAYNVFYGHAGLNVDWGYGIGGMQTPPGHRNSIHNGSFREVGIGVLDASNVNVGPQIVTQDFAAASGVTPAPVPFITGVAYYDFNSNGFYDLGEGIGGVRVDVPGSAYYAITSDSGGYAVPVTTNGNYAVQFSAPGLSGQAVASVASLKNVKLDFLPLYAPPVISGPNPAGLNQANTYTFTPVGGANNYQWKASQFASYTAIEGAENGLANVTVQTTPGYDVLDSSTSASGSYSFRLAHPSPPSDQFLTLNPQLRLSATSQLSFAKRLAYAASDEVAKAQLSVDGGTTWQDLWTQPGSNNSGESSFSTVTISLAAFAAQTAQFRFVFAFSSGSYYPASPGTGLYLDDIAVSNAEQVMGETVGPWSASTSFVFTPTTEANYTLQVRPQIGSRILPWGPALNVAAAAAPPTVQFTAQPTITGSSMQADFTIANAPAGTTYELWTAPAPGGPWSLDAGATFQTVPPNNAVRVTTSTGGAPSAFYRIKASY